MVYAEALGLSADVAENAALAHDIGHPPFGHIGEAELDKLVSEPPICNLPGDPDGFEGNAQSFRTLVRLAERIPNRGSLNLTRASLRGVIKYPWQRDRDNPARAHKFGCYSTESEAFDWVRSGLTEGERSAEAEIMDFSDDLAYAVHDLYDFFRAGMIPIQEIFRTKKALESFRRGVLLRRPDHRFWADKSAVELAFNSLRQFFLTVDGPFDNSRPSRYKLRLLSSVLIARYIRAWPAQQSAVTLRRRNGRVLVGVLENARNELTFLKELTWHYVIVGKGLAQLQHGQRAVIRALFESYASDAISPAPKLLPAWAIDDLESGTPAVRVVADVIASMTENQAYSLYHRLLGVQSSALMGIR